MKTPTTTLFDLIKSLDKMEKRYFLVHAGVQGTNNNYLKLFRAIEKQEVYDEKKLREKFKNEAFVKQLTVAKTYLYNLILKSLRNYHSEKSIDSSLKNRMMEAEILFEKGLLQQSLQMIEKVLKSARKYEKFPILSEALFLKDKIFAADAYHGISQQTLNDTYAEMRHAETLFNNFIEYRSIVANIFLRRSHAGNFRTEEDLKPFKKLMENKYLQNEKYATSTNSKLSFHLCWFIYYFIQSKYTEAIRPINSAQQIMENTPEIIKEDKKAYITLLMNKGACEFFLKRYMQALEVVKKLKAFYPECKPKDKKMIFYWVASAELSIYIRYAEIEKALKLLQEINKTIEKDKLTPLNSVDEIFLWSSSAYIYFIASDYKRSNEFLNRIINSNDSLIRADIYTIAMILQLIVHYESGKADLLEYSARSVYRYLYKKKRLYDLEKIILDFIRTKMYKIDDERKAIKAFEKLRSDIKKTHKDPLGKNLLGGFDLLSWLESKIQKKPFIEILKAKAEKLK